MFELKENKKEISLALLDSLFDVLFEKSEFLDIELFEIQLIKYGLDIDENLKELFSVFISKEKKLFQTEYFSEILAFGIKNKYEYFNKKLENLKLLYDLIIKIETHTEFNPLKYIDKIFDESLEQFYKFILFYIFKKENTFEINEFSSRNIELLINENTDNKENFINLELIFRNLKNIYFIIKYFLKFSKDKEFFKFILIRREVAENKVLEKLIKYFQNEDSLFFILFLIVINPYITIDDFKINIFKRNGFNFYLFLKAILYRIKYYRINQISPYEFLFLTDYLFEDYDANKVKDLIINISYEDVMLFEPLTTYVLNNYNEEFITVLFFKFIKAEVKNDEFVINYNSLNLLMEKVIQYNLTTSALNLLRGIFKKYLNPKNSLKENEVKNFFMAVNIFLVKTKLKKNLKEKIFKMNLKFYEMYSWDFTVLDPILLSVSEYYTLILNKYLKEFDSERSVDDFIEQIEKLIFGNNGLIVSKQININELEPESLIFSFTDKDIVNKIKERFDTGREKITIYSQKESKGRIISEKYYNILIFLKLTLIYDMFYFLFTNLEKQVVKKDKKYFYIIDGNDIKKYPLKEVKISKINFYWHFINKIYSFFLLVVFSMPAFKIIIDSVISEDIKLFFEGILVIVIALLLDFFLFFFFKKFEKFNFFKISLKDKDLIYISNEDNLSGFKINDNE